MKSRTRESGNSISFRNNGVDTLTIARSLALATALTLLVQPLVPVFAQTKPTTSRTATAPKAGNKIAFRLLAQTKSDAEDADADEAKKDAEKSKKDADKAKKEADKADKKAKETAKKAADEAKKAADDAQKAKAKKDADDKKVKEVKKADDKKDAKAAADEADKGSAKTKKKTWFGGKNGEKPVESGEVTEPTVSVEKKPVEVKQAAGAAKPTAGAAAKTAGGAAAKPGAAAVKPGAVVAPAEASADSRVEKPVLLPDKALVSVLKDISKSLSDVNTESGVETADEKVIVGLAKQLLDKALGASEMEHSRILAPEHSSTAKNSMTTEAWASGDIAISDKLRGSVATVWGKRINGSLHVTIAGECNDKVLSNGEKVGEFIVVIKGRSPVKSGFDIQSQSDVSYWIGSLNNVSVDNAVLRLKEKVEGEEGADSVPAEKPAETKGEVKKKSLVVLETILTRRGLEYLQALARYEHQQQTLIALQAAEASLTDSDNDTADDTEERLTGDEVKPSRTARAAADDDGDRVSRRSRNDDEDDDRVVRRSRASDEDEDRVSRRSRSSDEEDDRVARGSRSGGEDDDRVVRRSRSRDDDDDRSVKKASSNDERESNDADEQPTKANATKGGDAKTDEKKGDERRASDSGKTDGNGKSTAPAKAEASKTTAKKPVANNNDDDFSPGRVAFTPKEEENSKVVEQTPSAKPADSSWRDDWSRDGGDDPQSRKLTTVQASTLPTKTETRIASSQINTATPTNSSNSSSLSRISMSSPSPASATGFNRTWESPAVNNAPHAPSLDAALLIPERAIAGQFLTVVVQTKDHQPERSVELSFNGATLATDFNGQVSYMVPDDQPPGHTLHIGLAERPELNPRVVDILQPLDDSSTPRAPRIDRVSQVVAADGILVVDGHDFDGFAERNRLVIDNEHPAKVIASSPVQLRVLVPPKLTPGQHSVTINSTDLRSAPAKFDFVKTEIEQQDLRKTKGVLSKITVRVQGTKQPVPVRVINKTPDVIRFSRGDNLLVTTSGGVDNSYVVGVKQLKKGDYKVEASPEI